MTERGGGRVAPLLLSHLRSSVFVKSWPRVPVGAWFTRDRARVFSDDLDSAPGQTLVLCWPRDNKTRWWRARDDTKDDRDMEMEETVGGEAGLGLGMMPAGMRTREQTKTGEENQKWGRNQSKFSVSRVNM